MTYNGIHPMAEMVDGINPTGITLGKKEMALYEKRIIRFAGLEKWFVDIPANC